MEERRTSATYSSSTPLAREHARRRRRRKRRPSRAMRYFAAILVIILTFFVAYSIMSWIIENNSSNPAGESDSVTDDPVTNLQKRLDELSSENKLLTEEVRELQSQIDRYNAAYGPLDSAAGTAPSEGNDSGNTGSTGSTASPEQSGDTGSTSETPANDDNSGAEEI